VTATANGITVAGVPTTQVPAPPPHEPETAEAAPVVAIEPGHAPGPEPVREAVFKIEKLSVSYGSAMAVRDVDLEIGRHEITALIGPSGCGKSTFIRCLNRMNDLIDNARVTGAVRYHGVDLYGRDVSPVEVRRRIGMVFQKPTPFPKSIFDNVAYGPRIGGTHRGLDDIVEQALRRAALWDEVKDRLKSSALGMSGGQQQRLCIARALAVQPNVLLMDEPCSALDPTSTRRIEETIAELRNEVTVVIVTHNMQQALRVSDHCAFFLAEENEPGYVVEHGRTSKLFSSPDDPRTHAYVEGRFG